MTNKHITLRTAIDSFFAWVDSLPEEARQSFYFNDKLFGASNNNAFILYKFGFEARQDQLNARIEELEAQIAAQTLTAEKR